MFYICSHCFFCGDNHACHPYRNISPNYLLLSKMELYMHAVEIEVLSQIEQKKSISDRCLEQLNAMSLGSLSQEFTSNPSLKAYGQKNDQHLGLRLLLEEYLISDHSQQYLDDIDAFIFKLDPPTGGGTEEYQNKAAGTYLRPIPNHLICLVYQSEDDNLIKLFKKYASTPPTHLFKGTVPRAILHRDEAVLETMSKMDISAVEPHVIKMQRLVRMRNRYSEEVNRLSEIERIRQKNARNRRPENDRTPEQMRQAAKALIQDANVPYKPKCDAKLAARIMAAAKKVTAFTTVKHITSMSAIKDIFDDAFYGRRTLIDHFLDFNPAALSGNDIKNGDLNVVCLGPQQIDPIANGGIMIEFDLAKLVHSKPSAFFKQRDLEFFVDEHRSIQLGGETFVFNHTVPFRNTTETTTNTYFKFFDNQQTLSHYAGIPKASLISYNCEQIHEILTLNFFRYLDALQNRSQEHDQAFIDSFYQKIAQLNDDELLQFLTELVRKTTDTAEFNFYGAHKIDFSTVVSVTDRYKKHTLSLNTFINQMNQGNIDALRLARLELPQVFKSYRFIDYLLSNVQDANVRYYLDALRSECITPSWIDHVPLLVPEGFELDWTMSYRRVDQSNELSEESIQDAPEIPHASADIVSTIFQASP